MNTQILREQLLEGLLLSEKITGKNLALPVLHCVLLVAEGKTTTIRATNLEVGIEVVLPSKTTTGGTVAVPGSVLASVVAAAPSGSLITLSSTGSMLTVGTSGGTTKLKVLDADEFPTLPTLKDGAVFSVGADVLLRGIKAVAPSASLSTIKPELASIFIHPKGSKITFAATDSFRLAEKVVSLQQPVDGDPFLLPTRSVADILRVLEGVQGDVEVRYNEHQISISSEGTYFTSRLTEGTFPDYHQILPKEFVTEATVLKQDLITVLKKATIFSDRFHQATLTLEPKTKLFTIHAENADIGETTDTIPASLSGDALTIRFNQRYLTDSFQPIASDSIIFSFAGTSRPVVIKGVSDQSFFCLVMPMNK